MDLALPHCHQDAKLSRIFGWGDFYSNLKTEVEFDLERKSMLHPKDSKTFNCQVEYEKVEHNNRVALCNYDPSKTCSQEQTQSHVTCMCSMDHLHLRVFL
ncbi:unnamed protein product [Coregonus sp. 'balchen']|nr:unnamed protein product [Coregonus sp. 'balchen']